MVAPLLSITLTCAVLPLWGTALPSTGFAVRTPVAPLPDKIFSASHGNLQSDAASHDVQSDATSHDAFEQFKLYLEFQQHRDAILDWVHHRDEFMTWRQSKEAEVAKFMTWLLPQSTATDKGSTTLDDKIEPHRNVVVAPGLWQDSLMKSLSHVYRFIAQFYEKRLSRQWDIFGKSAYESYMKYVDDAFLVFTIILILVLYASGGIWGIVNGIWTALQHGVSDIANLLMGEKVIRRPGDKGDVEFEPQSEDAIKEKGVAKPAQMMFTQSFDDLELCQQHLLSKVGYSKGDWRKLEGEFVTPPKQSWTELSTINQERLRALGFTRRAWDLDDPDNLLISQKRWMDMSHFEQKEATQAGIEGAVAWDERKSEVFKTEFSDLTAQQRIHLRNLGFYQNQWVVAQEPIVPMENTVAYTCFTWLHYPAFVLWLAFELVFLCWILNEVGLLQFFWKNFLVYVVFVLVGAAIITAMVRTLFVPQMVRVHSQASIHVHVIMAHMRDMWDMLNRLCPATCKACQENCNCFETDQCCVLRCFSGLRGESSTSLAPPTNAAHPRGPPRPLLTMFSRVTHSHHSLSDAS